MSLRGKYLLEKAAKGRCLKALRKERARSETLAETRDDESTGSLDDIIDYDSIDSDAELDTIEADDVDIDADADDSDSEEEKEDEEDTDWDEDDTLAYDSKLTVPTRYANATELTVSAVKNKPLYVFRGAGLSALASTRMRYIRNGCRRVRTVVLAPTTAVSALDKCASGSTAHAYDAMQDPVRRRYPRAFALLWRTLIAAHAGRQAGPAQYFLSTVEEASDKDDEPVLRAAMTTSPDGMEFLALSRAHHKRVWPIGGSVFIAQRAKEPHTIVGRAAGRSAPGAREGLRPAMVMRGDADWLPSKSRKDILKESRDGTSDNILVVSNVLLHQAGAELMKLAGLAVQTTFVVSSSLSACKAIGKVLKRMQKNEEFWTGELLFVHNYGALTKLFARAYGLDPVTSISGHNTDSNTLKAMESRLKQLYTLIQKEL